MCMVAQRSVLLGRHQFVWREMSQRSPASALRCWGFVSRYSSVPIVVERPTRPAALVCCSRIAALPGRNNHAHDLLVRATDVFCDDPIRVKPACDPSLVLTVVLAVLVVVECFQSSSTEPAPRYVSGAIHCHPLPCLQHVGSRHEHGVRGTCRHHSVLSFTGVRLQRPFTRHLPTLQGRVPR